MKICVVGAAGKMAEAAVRDLVETEEVEAILLADLNEGPLEARRQAFASPKIASAVLDLRDQEALAKLLEPVDVCLNCTLPYFNEAIMEACLKAGSHYTDMGGLFHWAKKQLAMNDRFAAAGLTAVCGSGSAPGIVNVMARHAYLQLDSVEWVRIYDGIVNSTPPVAPLVPPYSLDTLLNEFLMSAWPFIDGDWKEFAPFSGLEEVAFPEPVGTQTCYYTIHSEPYTIAMAFADKGIRECFFKLALPTAFEQKLRFLCDLGAAETEAIERQGNQCGAARRHARLGRALPRWSRRRRGAEARRPQGFACRGAREQGRPAAGLATRGDPPSLPALEHALRRLHGRLSGRRHDAAARAWRHRQARCLRRGGVHTARDLLCRAQPARHPRRSHAESRLLRLDRSQTTSGEASMPKTILCFCRDVTAEDVKRAVAEGYDDMETLKRFTGAFTGPCQGKTCLDATVRLLAELSGRSVDRCGSACAPAVHASPPRHPRSFGGAVRTR